jgi:predicted dehydrogenase
MLNVGVIGTGSIARLSHVPAYKKLNTNIIAFADTDIKRAKNLAKRYKVEHVYADYIDLLENKDIDVVSICTPTFLHAPITIEAAKYDKHILVEKPMALSTKETEKMTSAASRHSVKLCVVQNYRYTEPVVKAMKMYKERQIGEISSILCVDHQPLFIGSPARWYFDADKTLGPLWESGVHAIDLVLYFLGKPKHVYASTRDYQDMGFDTDCKVMMEFENGTKANLDLTIVSSTDLFYLDLFGTVCDVHADVVSDILYTRYYRSSLIQETITNLARIKRLFGEAFSGRAWISNEHYHLIKDFISSIERDTVPPIPGDEGTRLIHVIETINESRKSGKKIKLE